MPGPVDRLQRAYEDAIDASGADFFLRLRDYQRLLTEDRAIKRAVGQVRKEAERADKAFVRADEGFVRELTTFRQQFARRVPEADDSEIPRPEDGGPPAPARSAEGHEWAYTLANFDAIVDDRGQPCRASGASRIREARPETCLGSASFHAFRPWCFPPRIWWSGMVERSSRHSEAKDPGPQAWCVCGEKVTIADAREVTLPNGRPGWEGRCPRCGAPLFAIRRKPAGH